MRVSKHEARPFETVAARPPQGEGDPFKSRTRSRDRGEAAAGAPRRGQSTASSPCAVPRRGAPQPARAPDVGAVAVGEDQPSVIGNDLAREIWRHGEIEPVAMRPVLGPFAVGLKVEQAGFDLDDPDVPAGRQANHIGAPAIGERKLGHHRMAERAQAPGRRRAGSRRQPPTGARRRPRRGRCPPAICGLRNG